MKLEAKLKAAFSRELYRQLPHFLVLHYVTAGAPDREIVGNGVTTRWEMKHATPDFASPGNQELCCMRLAVQGHCRYVLWHENSDGSNKRTLIVHPTHIHRKTDIVESSCDGHDHAWLVRQVRRAHHA